MVPFAPLFVALLATQSSDAIHSVSGPAPGARFGHAIAEVSDMDGDGIPELIVGAPGTNGAGLNSGAAFIYGSDKGHKLTNFVSKLSAAQMGWSVASAGDVNRDGFPDILVGGPGYKQKTGSVVLISGKNGVMIGQFNGFEQGEEQGAAIVVPGDLNGDGSIDYLFGAPGFSGRGGERCGTIRAYSGRNRQLLFEILGDSTEQRLGEKLFLLGDLDEDGVRDFAASNPSTNQTIIYSSASGEVIRRHQGPKQSDFGTCISVVPDFNRDNVFDYAIGAPQAINGSGQVTIFSGRDGRELKAIDGEITDGAFGTSLAASGHGLLIGEPNANETGRCRLYPLPSCEIEDDINGSYEGGKFATQVLAVAGITSSYFYVAAPLANGNGAESGNFCLFKADSSSSLAAVVPIKVKTTKADIGPVASDYLSLDNNFEGEEWSSIMDQHGRWTLWTSTRNQLAQETAALISDMFLLLDAAFGDPGLDSERPPLTLVLAGSKKRQTAVCESLKRTLGKRDGDWVEAASDSPHMLNHGLMLALVRHDSSTKNIKRPDVQLAHFAVQLEFARRFGAFPAWLPESISYGLQDTIVGEIYGYSNRGWEKLSDEYHSEWREKTSDLLNVELPDLVSLIGGCGQSFEQNRAYARFAFGVWLIKQPAGTLGKFAEALASLVGRGRNPGFDSGVSSDLQLTAISQSLGLCRLAKVGDFWQSVSLDGGPRARKRAAISAFETFAQQNKLSFVEDDLGSFRIYSDLGKSATKRAGMTIENGIRHLEKALGNLKLARDEVPPTVFILRDLETYQQLCDVAAKAVPTISSYLIGAKESVGFTLPNLPFSVYFDDPRSQAEAVPELSGLHNICHLWLRQKYGQLPLWFSEGLACAVEESARSLVYGYWNMSGFIYSWTHSEWRSRAAEFVSGSGNQIEAYDWTGVPYGNEPPKVKMARPSLEDLYQYRALVFREELAHLGFAFAVYGLEQNPKGLQKFCRNLQKEYSKNWITVGRFEPSAEWTKKCVKSAFGSKFSEQFRAFWQQQ